MKDLGSVRLTQDQESLMSRVMDSLKKGDHEIAKENLSLLIQSLSKTTPEVSESDIDSIILQTAILKASPADDFTDAPLTPGDLANEIKILENAKEEIRRARSDYQTTFENFDQKANQLF